MRKLSLTSIYERCTRKGECRLWTGARSGSGHPFVYDPAIHAAAGKGGGHKNGSISGRIAVWKLAHDGLAPAPGLKVIMTCQDRACLWAAHMQAATPTEAAAHAKEIGAFSSLRRRIANGATARKNAKVNRAMAEAIAAARATTPRRELAAQHNVSLSTVEQVLYHRRRAYQPLPNSSVFHMEALCPSP